MRNTWSILREEGKKDSWDLEIFLFINASGGFDYGSVLGSSSHPIPVVFTGGE